MRVVVSNLRSRWHLDQRPVNLIMSIVFLQSVILKPWIPGGATPSRSWRLTWMKLFEVLYAFLFGFKHENSCAFCSFQYVILNTCRHFYEVSWVNFHLFRYISALAADTSHLFDLFHPLALFLVGFGCLCGDAIRNRGVCGTWIADSARSVGFLSSMLLDRGILLAQGI
jgi:hypothetical protein